MATERDNVDDTELLALFAAARTAPPEPSDALRARVLADANRVVSEQRAAGRRPVADRPAGWLSGIWTVLGGWQGGAGLAAATIAGLAIGFGAPGVVPGVGSAESDLVDGVELAVWLWPGVDAVMDMPLSNDEG
jgi:hypothetical protein